MSQTQWFDGNLKPQVDGVYKRRFTRGPAHWAKFERGLWYYADINYETAKAETIFSPVQDSALWAGCTETDWIPGKIKPVRDGVYKRIYENVYARFSKGLWYAASSFYHVAETETVISSSQTEYLWKGIHHEHQ